MKKQLLKAKGELIHGVFIPSEVYINKSIKEHCLNKGKKIKLGWNAITSGCVAEDKPAPPDGEVGAYFCVGNEWVWFPG